MQKDYYNADPRLVDPLLARVIRALKIQGHKVFGLTSNDMDNAHTTKVLETLASYKIRQAFSRPEVKGELPRSGAVVMDHPVARGIIFTSNRQAVHHDKGEVIAEFVTLLLRKDGWGYPHPGSGPRRERHRRQCLLVDNTAMKCERAAASFLSGRGHTIAAGAGLDLLAVHFTEAENLVDLPKAFLQLERILERLQERQCIDTSLAAKDFFKPGPGAGGTGGRGRGEG
ncbi:unnamed protein product [Discosporangium mesarthrocarpum]